MQQEELSFPFQLRGSAGQNQALAGHAILGCLRDSLDNRGRHGFLHLVSGAQIGQVELDEQETGGDQQQRDQHRQDNDQHGVVPGTVIVILFLPLIGICLFRNRLIQFGIDFVKIKDLFFLLAGREPAAFRSFRLFLYLLQQQVVSQQRCRFPGAAANGTALRSIRICRSTNVTNYLAHDHSSNPHTAPGHKSGKKREKCIFWFLSKAPFSVPPPVVS